MAEYASARALLSRWREEAATLSELDALLGQLDGADYTVRTLTEQAAALRRDVAQLATAKRVAEAALAQAQTSAAAEVKVLEAQTATARQDRDLADHACREVQKRLAGIRADWESVVEAQKRKLAEMEAAADAAVTRRMQERQDVAARALQETEARQAQAQAALDALIARLKG